MPIQRYTHYDHTGNDDTHAFPDDEEGGWCSDTDVAARDAEIAALRASREARARCRELAAAIKREANRD